MYVCVKERDINAVHICSRLTCAMCAEVECLAKKFCDALLLVGVSVCVHACRGAVKFYVLVYFLERGC